MFEGRKFALIKGVFRSCRNEQEQTRSTKIKRTNTDLQNTTQKTKDRATRTSLKTNNDLQNTTQKTKHRATRTPLKTNNDLQNTTQKTKH
jgi:BRCT domain type II-containing protein